MILDLIRTHEYREIDSEIVLFKWIHMAACSPHSCMTRDLLDASNNCTCPFCGGVGGEWLNCTYDGENAADREALERYHRSSKR
jgi:sarcosine oxidase delta subunit